MVDGKLKVQETYAQPFPFGPVDETRTRPKCLEGTYATTTSLLDISAFKPECHKLKTMFVLALDVFLKGGL